MGDILELKPILTRTNEELLTIFYNLKNRNDVCDLLEIDDKTLIYILYRGNLSRWYENFDIPKKDGTFRKISAPKSSLKILQSKLNQVLQLVYHEKSNVNAHGFIKNRSIITNSKEHINKNIILNIDIKDFFPSINFGRVRGLFIKAFNIGERAATVLAQLTCYNNELPQGSPCSPVISNLICRNLDKDLFYLSTKNGCKYSRFADDITFSTNNDYLSDGIVRSAQSTSVIVLGDKLLRVFKNNGFEINTRKVRMAKKHEHQEVTGLVVNKKINIKKRYLKEIRSMIHKAKSNGIYEAALEYFIKHRTSTPENEYIDAIISQDQDNLEEKFLQIMQGKLSFLKMVRGESDLLFAKYASEYNHLCGYEHFKVNSILNPFEVFEDHIFVVKNSTQEYIGSCFALKNFGYVTCAHVVKDDDFYSLYNPIKKIVIRPPANLIKVSENDIALFKSPTLDTGFNLNGGYENHDLYKNGTDIIFAGYPEYNDEDNITLCTAKITGSRNYLGTPVYTVDKQIFKGTSGGPVFDTNMTVIGIVRSGTSMTEENGNVATGFIPIKHLIPLNDPLDDR